MAQNALELSVSVPNNSTPNTSINQDTSIVTKMRTYIDERPDLRAFTENNAKFIDCATMHSTKIAEIHGRLNQFGDTKDKLILEISHDIRDDILQNC